VGVSTFLLKVLITTINVTNSNRVIFFSWRGSLYYSNLLIQVDATNATPNLRIDSPAAFQPAAATARANLLGSGWIINDAGAE
jgi:hypothetical protein